MKKTLFLSAIFGAALCSTAMAAETITVDGTTYTAAILSAEQAENPDTTVHAYFVNYNGGNTAFYHGQRTDANKKKNPWIGNLTSEDTLIFADPDGDTYGAHSAFFDTGTTSLTVNANIVVGGSSTDSSYLRFWTGGTNVNAVLNGNVKIAGQQANMWLQNGLVSLNGKLMATESQVLHLTNNSPSTGTLNLSGDMSEFSGTIKVDGGRVHVGGNALGIGYGTGSVLKYNAGVLDSANSTLRNLGASWTASLTTASDGRYQTVKNGETLIMTAGSEEGIASITTTGTNGGWILAQNIGNTTTQKYTDITLNSSADGFCVMQANTEAHIGALAGTSGTAAINGAYGSGGNRSLVLHQNTNTTFAGKISHCNDSDGVRDIKVVKKGSGTLTLTGNSNSRSGLTLEEGGIKFTGTGSWTASAITVEGGVLTLDGTAGTFGDIVNNGTVALTNIAHGEAYARGANGYNTTHDVVTLSNAGTLSGTGAWTLNGVTATFNAATKTLEADVLDSAHYHVDKTDVDYSASLAGKYVVAEGRELRVAGEKTWVNVGENNGTVVLDGMVGYFHGSNVSLGDVRLEGDGLKLTNGFNGSLTTIGNLSGTGNIERTNINAGTETYAVTGDVTWSGSLIHDRSGKTMVVRFDSSDVSFGGIESKKGTLNIESANGVTVDSVTLSSGSVTGIYTGTTHNADTEASLTTSSLTVSGDATLNADLVTTAGSTLYFGGVLTMGSSVEFGDGTIIIVSDAIASQIANGDIVTLIDSIDADTDINSLKGVGIYTGSQETGLVYITKTHVLTHGDGTLYVVTPEPATATLSLLALAGLCARRRRH